MRQAKSIVDGSFSVGNRVSAPRQTGFAVAVALPYNLPDLPTSPLSSQPPVAVPLGQMSPDLPESHGGLSPEGCPGTCLAHLSGRRFPLQQPAAHSSKGA